MSKYFIFIPNLLSIIRIGLVYPILNNIFIGNFIISLGYFLIASLTDALDGFLARKMKWQTYLGTILDPIADKLLLSGTVFILWLNSYIPLYIFVIFIGNFIISLGYFLIASLTDALDGFLARKMSWQTYLGTILDPIADKLLLSGTIFILWLNSYIPLYIFVIFIGRDVAILLGAAVHMTLMESETPLPNILGKITTGLQIAYIVVILFFQIFEINLSLIVLDIFIIIVTLLSLIVYSRNWLLDINKYHNE